MSQDTTMLHVYGWRRDGGPFFLDNPHTLKGAIASAGANVSRSWQNN